MRPPDHDARTAEQAALPDTTAAVVGPSDVTSGVPAEDGQIITGGGDSLLHVWRDVTAEKAELAVQVGGYSARI